MLSNHLSKYAVVGLGLAIAIGACEGESDPIVTAPDQALTSVTPDCEACLVDLVECTSTSVSEEEFVQCRDIFQGCQSERGLSAEACSNPSDADACLLCTERLHTCDGEGCETQFTVCRSLLMTNSAGCGNETAAPSGSNAGKCKVCLDGVGSCAASLAEGGDPAVCGSAFEQCKASNQLPPEECPYPAGGRACDLCDVYQANCDLSGDVNCAEGYAACVGNLAPDQCDDGGGGGAGGGGPAPDTCGHNECGEGPKLDGTCSPCASEVCAIDPYCCDTDWDYVCVAIATDEALSCNCAAGCEHSECETGAKLTNTCSPCAQAVCAGDPFCCNGEWDLFCLDVVEETPECACE